MEIKTIPNGDKLERAYPVSETLVCLPSEGWRCVPFVSDKKGTIKYWCHYCKKFVVNTDGTHRMTPVFGTFALKPKSKIAARGREA
jgi:hypothetical protein